VEPTVATVVLLLVQVPPPAVLPSVVVAPAHTCNVPLITDGAKFTIMVVVVAQPAAVVYVITVVPARAPVTIPAVLMEATEVVPLPRYRR